MLGILSPVTLCLINAGLSMAGLNDGTASGIVGLGLLCASLLGSSV